MRTLVFATGNEHKVSELRAILNDVEVELRHLGEYLDASAAEETGETFAENALAKAVHLSTQLRMPCCADDSGLMVHALGGDPGVRSARYAGDDADDQQNNRLLLERMRGEDRRTACFVCSIALAVPDGDIGLSTPFTRHGWVHMPDKKLRVWTAEATVYGHLLDEPRGSEGFGYDPLFLYPATGFTFAEMNRDEKNEVSHRGRAFRMMARELRTGGLL